MSNDTLNITKSQAIIKAEDKTNEQFLLLYVEHKEKFSQLTWTPNNWDRKSLSLGPPLPSIS